MYFGILLPSPVFIQQAILKHSQHELDTWVWQKSHVAEFDLQFSVCKLRKLGCLLSKLRNSGTETAIWQSVLIHISINFCIMMGHLEERLAIFTSAKEKIVKEHPDLAMKLILLGTGATQDPVPKRRGLGEPDLLEMCEADVFFVKNLERIQEDADFRYLD